MNFWLRLLHQVMRYRRTLAISLVLGMMVALLWSAELALSFPVIKIFLQGQTLREYFRNEIVLAEEEIAQRQSILRHIDVMLDKIEQSDKPGDREQLQQLSNDRAQLQRKYQVSVDRHWMMVWAESVLQPIIRLDSFQFLALTIATLAFVTFLKGICTYYQDVVIGRVAERVIVDLRLMLFRRILQRDPYVVSASGVPQMSARFSYNLQSLANGLNLLGGKVVREPLKGLACLTAVLMINWRLATLSLLFFPLAGWVFHVIGTRLRAAAQRSIESMGLLYARLEESFDNFLVVMAFHAGTRQRKVLQQRNRDYYNQAMKIIRIDAMIGPTTESLAMLAAAAALLPGAYLVLSGETHIATIRLTNSPMDVAELGVIYAMLAGVIDPLRKFAKFATTIKQCGVTCQDLFETMDEPDQRARSTNPQPAQPLESSLDFQEVCFRYPGSSNGLGQRGDVLHDLQLSIRAGEFVAIVGPNGSGKSTMVSLIPKFSDPAAGRILWNGIDLREYRQRDLCQQLAVVSQDAILINGSIADNIRYGSTNATDGDVVEAARAARVMEFARTFPEGLATRIGDGGREVSGGQRQRIAFARALLRKPSVLILDEPTSAIDAQSEQAIEDCLAEFSKGRTVLLVTHSLSSRLLQLINRIVVMDHGRIIAEGSHAELQTTCPIYRRLFAAPRTEKAA